MKQKELKEDIHRIPHRINYDMKFSVSNAAQILLVDKQLIKKWAFRFADYLNPKANPVKGKEKEFTADDLCTLGYISFYWEDEPDIESIKYGLNSGYQFDYPYNEIGIEATPIFRDFTEDFTDQKVWLIGGCLMIPDIITLADSYKFAGDTLLIFQY